MRSVNTDTFVEVSGDQRTVFIKIVSKDDQALLPAIVANVLYEFVNMMPRRFYPSKWEEISAQAEKSTTDAN